MRLIDADALWMDVIHSMDYCDDILEMIESQPTIEQKSQWIPCSERLPEEGHRLDGSGNQFSDEVLVSIYNSPYEDEWVDFSQTIDGKWIIEPPGCGEIVAWMPLPEPYNERIAL